MSAIIRPAGPNDMPQVVAQWRELHAWHQSVQPGRFAASLENRSGPAPWDAHQLLADAALLVAVEPDDFVLGFVALSVRHDDSTVLRARRYAAIAAIAVDARCRRRGVGRLLLEAADTWALGVRATELRLNVWDFNDGAKELYRRAGYAVQRLTLARTLGAGGEQGQTRD